LVMQLERQTIKFSKDPSGKAKGEPDQQYPLLTLPFVPCRKWKEKWALSEPQASFARFPFFARHKREPEGQRLAVAFFCLLFLAKQEK